ncbi:ATP-binding protein [Duganella vulcania]|uniref:AAA family ATPase n=1 Tax=Duganella vulcania TaxID=2692166 RepID=A0A845GRK0_9BURK|nr:ATP-binding protein [Duganella vulcania]MYM96245.1 hypothetical protein [Duganella vulcania]
MIGNNQVAEIHVVLGSSGGGKTTQARGKIMKKRRRRTIVWSPKEPIDNYASWWPGSVVCTTTAEVLAIVQAAGKRGEFHIVFRPSLNRSQDEAQFNVVCRIALAAHQLLFVVDELHTVTKPSHSVDGWGKLVMMGRGYGIEIWGMSQRPASMDKDFMGNASTIHTRRLSYPEDAKTVARSLGVKPAEVSALSGYMWIERNNQTGEISRG